MKKFDTAAETAYASMNLVEQAEERDAQSDKPVKPKNIPLSDQNAQNENIAHNTKKVKKDAPVSDNLASSDFSEYSEPLDASNVLGGDSMKGQKPKASGTQRSAQSSLADLLLDDGNMTGSARKLEMLLSSLFELAKKDTIYVKLAYLAKELRLSYSTIMTAKKELETTEKFSFARVGQKTEVKRNI